MSRVYAVGYSFGGNVALHAAALDSRLSGVVSIAGFTPMRTDPCGGTTGGICRLFDWHALIPRLGIFQVSAPSTRVTAHRLLTATI